MKTRPELSGTSVAGSFANSVRQKQSGSAQDQGIEEIVEAIRDA
jgi:hypothetical protein